MDNKIKGACIAMATAGLFACSSGGTASSVPASAASAEMVKCSGINECKGTGECGGKAHSCAGHNECKGQGWVKTSADMCSSKGGTVI